MAVLGRSGAGKSTLIRCINRLVEPDAGTVRWNGRELTGVPPRLLRERRREIGMIFQHFHLLPRLTVKTNVLSGRFAAMPLWRPLFGAFAPEHREAAREALQRVGLAHLASRRVEELSGGSGSVWR
ncbi:ATP-binding cassette domain-containing protein [Paenibacillus sp. CC-CFT747]|nr:ATP-binding cassette domain-containing protein [Paenibacillus sp. CC-CFT747]